MIGISFKGSLYYRKSILLDFVLHPIAMVMFIFVFTALYRHTGSATLVGYDLTQMIWYMASGHFIWSIVWNNTDWRIANRILSGDLVQDLLRPVTLLKIELATDIGGGLVAACTEFIPDMVFLPLFYMPSFMTVGSALRFIPLVIGAFLLFFHFNFLIGLLAFAMKSTKSIFSIRYILVATLGGSFLPLDFFPSFLRTINSFLPFQYIFYWPARVFINMEGTQTLEGYFTILGVQAAWVLGLHLLCRFFWRGAYRKFCAVGG
jgi:ABC-2 type transport system permease protein